jgi:tRNA-specific 2-thiouridylase
MSLCKNKKVAVAMSGGVDSSVTAGLLLERGYDVQGVSLRLWEGRDEVGPRNCSDHRGAQEVAATLGIPHKLLDLRAQFVATLVRPFAQDYLRGRTPNPCIACNRDFKLGALLDWAREEGVDYVATGHYARVVREKSGARLSLFRGADRGKDQSYFLFALGQEQLAHTLFPLGELQKSEVRDKARRLGLPVAERPESQDICFGDYRSLVESCAGTKKIEGGEVIDRAGNVLGRHNGIHAVTIGQRRGLGIAGREPLYVIEIQGDRNKVVVGKREELACKGLLAVDVNWIAPPVEEEFDAAVQIRYGSAAIPCTVRTDAYGRCEAGFIRECPAVTPGQAAVFYRGDQVLGGGWIEQAIKE